MICRCDGEIDENEHELLIKHLQIFRVFLVDFLCARLSARTTLLALSPALSVCPLKEV